MIPNNAVRVKHHFILFQPTEEELQINKLREQLDQQEQRYKLLEDKLNQVINGLQPKPE